MYLCDFGMIPTPNFTLGLDTEKQVWENEVPKSNTGIDLINSLVPFLILTPTIDLV